MLENENPPPRGIVVRVLLVEDQTALVKALRQGMEEEGFAVDTAVDGEEADVKARSTQYDVIVLDVMFPKQDGFTLLKKWRGGGGVTPDNSVTGRGAAGDEEEGGAREGREGGKRGEGGDGARRVREKKDRQGVRPAADPHPVGGGVHAPRHGRRPAGAGGGRQGGGQTVRRPGRHQHALHPPIP